MEPKPQELYKHFKGNLYQVITVAIHSETEEKMVVYQALYGDYKMYCRPLDSFMSMVDSKKYPEHAGEKRFTLVEKKDNSSKKDYNDIVAFEKSSDDSFTQTVKSGYMEKTIEDEAEELHLDPLVIQFMDAFECAERISILEKLRPIITNEMIDLMAMAVDTEVREGDVLDRYNELKDFLITKEKYETNRLRS
ncbi:MAG: DUF1653 domain-containing protein [Butyrivibrio sp.]|nr:DUF1653 domain-containing protein [Butyrivibrio sp.]